MQLLEFNPAAKDVVCRVYKQYPDTPFLALGQTIFWDEPTKACFTQFLHECIPTAEFWHGIHDTDYFSRIPRPVSSSRSYAVVEHNDTATGGLWVAMCEAARLFSAEAVPTLAHLRQYGCNIEKALPALQAKSLSLDSITTAWGWKGIVSTGGRELVARDVLLADIAEELAALLNEAMQGTIETILNDDERDHARTVMQDILQRMETYIRQNPAATLSQLYLHLLPYLYELLLGKTPENLRLTASASLFRFNPQTAGRPLFLPLRLFLHPASRLAARRAYDDAVAGSGIYILDQFGPDAIPFDLVIPGRGRGTICSADNEVVVHTTEPISIPVSQRIESPEMLAEVVSKHLGDDVALVGKAVVLIPMIAQEFILVFHQGASAYTEHTHEFITSMEREGISLNCRPILRLCHQAWDAFGAAKAAFRLPDHLTQAFGKSEISAQEFSLQWRAACARQKELLKKLATTRKPSALMTLLAENTLPIRENGKMWQEKLAAYIKAREEIAEIGKKIASLQQKKNALRHESYRLRQEIQQLEKAKGQHFHDVLYPLLTQGAPTEQEEAKRREFQQRIAEKRAALEALQKQLSQVRMQQEELEQQAEQSDARHIIENFESEVEVERLLLTRNAILTIYGLDLTNRRPTGWWFPMASPDGAWFAQLARTSTLEVESLCHADEGKGKSS